MSAFLTATAALLAIANPVGAAPVFVELTSGQPSSARRRSAERAAFAVFLILAVAAVVGRPLLSVLGISLDAFRAGGGLVILLMAVEMLRGSPTRLQSHGQATGAADDSIIVPFAMPLVAGPGAITTIITLTARDSQVTATFTAVAAAAVVAAVLLGVLYGSAAIAGKLSPRAHAIIIRFLGLVLAAIGSQFILDGIRAFFVG